MRSAQASGYARDPSVTKMFRGSTDRRLSSFDPVCAAPIAEHGN